MAFAMKGGVSYGINFFSNMFLKNKHLESFPDCENVSCT